MSPIDPATAIRVQRPSDDHYNLAAKHRADALRCPCTSCDRQASCLVECESFREYVKLG